MDGSGGLVGGGGGFDFLNGFLGGGGRSGLESGLVGRGGRGGDLVMQQRPWECVFERECLTLLWLDGYMMTCISRDVAHAQDFKMGRKDLIV